MRHKVVVISHRGAGVLLGAEAKVSKLTLDHLRQIGRAFELGKLFGHVLLLDCHRSAHLGSLISDVALLHTNLLCLSVLFAHALLHQLDLVLLLELDHSHGLFFILLGDQPLHFLYTTLFARFP